MILFTKKELKMKAITLVILVVLVGLNFTVFAYDVATYSQASLSFTNLAWLLPVLLAVGIGVRFLLRELGFSSIK